MVNDIIFGLGIALLVVCIISAATEIIQPKKKKTFNFFRSIRVKVREISFVFAVILSLVIVLINIVSGDKRGHMLPAEILVVFLCLLTVHGERIFSKLKSRKKDNPKPVRPVIKCRLLKELPKTKTLETSNNVLPERKICALL